MGNKIINLECRAMGYHSIIETLLESIMGCTDTDMVSEKVSVDVCNLVILIRESNDKQKAVFYKALEQLGGNCHG